MLSTPYGRRGSLCALAGAGKHHRTAPTYSTTAGDVQMDGPLDHTLARTGLIATDRLQKIVPEIFADLRLYRLGTVRKARICRGSLAAPLPARRPVVSRARPAGQEPPTPRTHTATEVFSK